jgi:hypothetical protein
MQDGIGEALRCALDLSIGDPLHRQ